MNNKEYLYTLKKLIYLHDIVIKLEKSDNQAKLLKIFKSGKVIVSLSALAWKKENYKDYKRYFSEKEISNKEFASLCEKEIKETLICDIFQQVIKNNIMML